MILIRIWPILAFGLLGLLIGCLITDFFEIEPQKMKGLLIACFAIVGSIIGWKFISKE